MSYSLGRGGIQYFVFNKLGFFINQLILPVRPLGPCVITASNFMLTLAEGRSEEFVLRLQCLPQRRALVGSG